MSSIRSLTGSVERDDFGIFYVGKVPVERVMERMLEPFLGLDVFIHVGELELEQCPETLYKQ